jgi:signal transduction histidine kinase
MSLLGLTFRAALELRMMAGLYAFDEIDREAFIAERVGRLRDDGQERTFQLRDGRWMQTLNRVTPDEGVIHVWTDVTGIKAAETQQRDLQDQLHHSQRLESLGTLAGGIAHDLNNTLVPILGLVELTAEVMAEGSSDRRNLEIVADAARHAKGLVGQILAFSRKEPGHLETFDLAQLVREALTLLRSAVPATIAIDRDIADVPPVRGDDGQLHQVIVNLVTNAAQAIGDDRGVISVSLGSVERDGAAPSVRLRVADTGCGMDEATRARIFEPFFTTKPVNEGSGLGLSVVHGIVTAHGGTISVASAIGQGTAFEMDLPIASA